MGTHGSTLLELGECQRNCPTGSLCLCAVIITVGVCVCVCVRVHSYTLVDTCQERWRAVVVLGTGSEDFPQLTSPNCLAWAALSPLAQW